MKKTLLVAALALLTSCASSNEITGTQDTYSDPLEGYNRGMTYVNNKLDDYVLDPITKGYRYVTPDFLRNMISNALSNIGEPLNMVNNVLQGDFSGAGNNIARFGVNTTVGLLGTFDVATKEGISEDNEDLGQTLASWGVGSGPYLVLPILGPSNFRDGFGIAVSSFVNPVHIYADNTDRDGVYTSYLALKLLSTKDEYMDTMRSIRETSMDPYAALKSIYRQNRRDAISDGMCMADEFPEYDEYGEEIYK